MSRLLAMGVGKGIFQPSSLAAAAMPRAHRENGGWWRSEAVKWRARHKVGPEAWTMLHLTGSSGSRMCDGLTRREWLRIGGLALGGLTLPGLLAGRAQPPASPRRPKRCLQLFMWGGPAQQETFDLKPHAPDGVRSLFRPIATCVPGIQICEHLPRLARMADRYAILRSVTHTGVNHGTSAYHMLTGHIHFAPGTLRHPTPNDFPSIGCAVSRFGRQPPDVPAFVALPSVLHDG